MVFVALESLDEKNRFHERGGNLCHPVFIVNIGHMKGLLIGIKIVSKPLDYLSVPKMDHDLVFDLRHDPLLFSFPTQDSG